METEMLRAFFGWCAVINIAILLLSFIICLAAREWIYRMHSRWFSISREAFNVSIYCFIGAMKILVLFLNVVPYLTLLILG